MARNFKKEFDTIELAERWGLNPQTLINWRSQNRGPTYYKKGKSRTAAVVYKLDDIVKYENTHFETEIKVKTTGT